MMITSYAAKYVLVMFWGVIGVGTKLRSHTCNPKWVNPKHRRRRQPRVEFDLHAAAWPLQELLGI